MLLLLLLLLPLGHGHQQQRRARSWRVYFPGGSVAATHLWLTVCACSLGAPRFGVAAHYGRNYYFLKGRGQRVMLPRLTDSSWCARAHVLCSCAHVLCHRPFKGHRSTERVRTCAQCCCTEFNERVHGVRVLMCSAAAIVLPRVTDLRCACARVLSVAALSSNSIKSE